ncbi:MAG: CcoQ/FixQ family Cbb3-type cytochrome c oxidase assembly chaperone [Planctomycetes bacterium]|nr:CcoQ/FixQ family Cbb3-type cytochrome c oxidase assembly chaperone [Planctomycetota bacterium]
MFKDLFRNATLLDLPLWAMFGFIAVFGGVVCWTMSRRRTTQFDTLSRMPLDD